MRNKSKENSVRNLVALYTVIIGVALSLAVRTLVDIDRGLESVTLSASLLFTALLLTLIPFYHGALRHLDDSYIENDSVPVKDGALIMDVLLLLLHSLTFVVLGLLLRTPGHFVWVLSVLLAIDVVWGFFAHFASSSESGLSAQLRWAIINLVFVAVAVGYLVTNEIYLSEAPDPLKVAVLTVFACAIRTLADYVWCREFYFPPDEKAAA